MSGPERGTMVVRALLAIGVLVLLVGAGVADPARGGVAFGFRSPSVSGRGTIAISATRDYGYQPDTIGQVPTASNISVTFTDLDVLQHSFTISSREGFVIPTGYSDQQLAAFLATYPPMFSLLVNGSGEVATGNFTSPATPGWYEFVCDVSGHFQNGMYGFIAFGENVPSNLTRTPRTGLGLSSLTPLDGAAIAALFVAFLLALVVWRLPRSRPKERPEPPSESPPRR